MTASFLIRTAFLWLLCPAAVHAQTGAPPAVPLVAVPRQETLRLKFTAGQTWYYRRTEETEGFYLEPHGRLTPIKSHLEMQEHLAVTDVREADSAGLIAAGVDSMTVTVDGKLSPSPGDGAAVSDAQTNLAEMADLARLVVLPNGKFEETLVNPTFNADEALPGEDPVHMGVLAGVGQLPAMPVQAGDRWKSLVFLGMIGEHSAADETLSGWETKEDAPIAVIKQVIHGTFGTPTHPAGDMKIKGWMSGTRTVRLNTIAGVVDAEDSLIAMTVVLTPRGDDGKFLTAPTRMWVKVTCRMTRIPIPADVQPVLP